MNFFSWLKSLFKPKSKTDWDTMPYKAAKYEEPDIIKRNES